MYASSQNLNMSRSFDGGYSWASITGELYGNDAAFVAPYVLCPSQPWILFGGTDYLLRSENYGTNWAIMNGFQPLNGNNLLALAIAVAPDNPDDVVYCATTPGTTGPGVFVSTDGGATTTDITPQPARPLFRRHAGFAARRRRRVHHRVRIRLVSSVQDDERAAPRGRTSTADCSRTCRRRRWSSSIRSTTTTLYVGNDLGVYVSTDYGSTWQDYGDGLPSAVMVFDLVISESNYKLRAFTYGNGMFERSLLSDPTGVEGGGVIVSDYELKQNYPNPFNPSTRIDFSLPEAADVSLKIYSITGREVKTIMEHAFPQGNHSVTWRGNDNSGRPVASGTYFYRLAANGRVMTKRLTVVR